MLSVGWYQHTSDEDPCSVYSLLVEGPLHVAGLATTVVVK